MTLKDRLKGKHASATFLGTTKSAIIILYCTVVLLCCARAILSSDPEKCYFKATAGLCNCYCSSMSSYGVVLLKCHCTVFTVFWNMLLQSGTCCSGA